MAFDDDLWQTHVIDRADYRRRKNQNVTDGYGVISPVYGHWLGKEYDSFLNQADEAGIDFRFIILNDWFDLQFFFKSDEAYSFFLIKFSNELSKKEDLGYVR